MGLASWRDFIVLTKWLGEGEARAAFRSSNIGWLFELLASNLHDNVPEADVQSLNPRFVPPLAPRLRIAALGWTNDSPAVRHRLAWATRLPILNACAFLAGTAFPSNEYIRSRHGTLANYWKRGWRETLSTASGSDFRMTTVDDYEPES